MKLNPAFATAAVLVATVSSESPVEQSTPGTTISFAHTTTYTAVPLRRYQRRSALSSPTRPSLNLDHDNYSAISRAASVASILATAAPSSVVFGGQDPLEMMRRLAEFHSTEDWYRSLDRGAKNFLGSMPNAVQPTPFPTAQIVPRQTEGFMSRIDSVASVISTAAPSGVLKEWTGSPVKRMEDLMSGAHQNEDWFLNLPSSDKAFLAGLGAVSRARLSASQEQINNMATPTIPTASNVQIANDMVARAVEPPTSSPTMIKIDRTTSNRPSTFATSKRMIESQAAESSSSSSMVEEDSQDYPWSITMFEQ